MKRWFGLGLLLLSACKDGAPPQSTEDLSSPPPVMDLRQPPGMDLRMMQIQDGLMPGDMTTVGYPAGPYGFLPGSTLYPMEWEGFVNPTAVGAAGDKAYGAYAANDLRLSGKKFALLYAADDF